MDRWIPYNIPVPRWSKRCLILLILLILFLLIFSPSYIRYFFWKEVEIRGKIGAFIIQDFILCLKFCFKLLLHIYLT